MSGRSAVIGRARSGVVGGHAVIPGMAAAVLVRAVGDGDWRRAVPPGTPPEGVEEIEEAVAALRVVAAVWLEGLQRERLPGRGSGEGQRQPQQSPSDEWVTTREAASLSGKSERRIRQLGQEGALEWSMIAGRLYWRATQVSSLPTTRA